MEDLSADWEHIGEFLGFRPPEINAIRHAGAGRTPFQCLRDVFTKWLDNTDDKQHFPSNWTGLYNLLVDSQHRRTAKDLKFAIEASYSDLHQNFGNCKINQTLL